MVSISCGSNNPARRWWQHPPNGDHPETAKPLPAQRSLEKTGVKLPISGVRLRVGSEQECEAVVSKVPAAGGRVRSARSAQDSTGPIQASLRGRPTIFVTNPRWVG